MSMEAKRWRQIHPVSNEISSGGVGLVRWCRFGMWDEPWDFEGSHWHDLVMQRSNLNFLGVFNIRANFTPRPTCGQVQTHDLQSGDRRCSRLQPVEDFGFDDNLRKVRPNGSRFLQFNHLIRLSRCRRDNCKLPQIFCARCQSQGRFVSGTCCHLVAAPPSWRQSSHSMKRSHASGNRVAP